jgi:leucyl aminopeptidase
VTIEVSVAGRRMPAADRIVVGVLAREKSPPAALDREARAAFRRLAARPGFAAEAGQSAEGEAGPRRTLQLAGLGPGDKLDVRKLRSFVEKAVESARTARERRLAIVLPEHALTEGTAAAARIAREALLAGYRFDRFRSEAKPARLRSVALVPPAGEGAAYREGVEVGRAIAGGIVVARDLANTPPNEATPAWIAARARALARRWRARVAVLGPGELARRGMFGILAVGGGSANPPRLVRIELGRGPRTVALVGKGVTFDTGGISIKPADRMDEMKWDKCGACAVLGALEALAALRLPLRVRAYLPLAENMPSGTAYRPGDIVRCANGKTVEILNTDAEGRMILAEALAWAASEKPDWLVEFSTLTGACVVALGPTGAGLFSPSDELADGLLAAAEEAGERLWRMPLWSEFLEEMRGAHADLKNSGGRWGGAATAAAFLSQFVGEVERWAHLDIAGPAYLAEGKEKRGATGYGVALTIGWLRALAAARRRR